MDRRPSERQHVPVTADRSAGSGVPDDYEADLVEWGKAVRLTTTGRRSGRSAGAVVGFVEEPGGNLLVAAGSRRANWALNLLADPACEVTLRGTGYPARAERLEGPERAKAVVDLILKYGTPSERLGAGPVFRLRPAPGPRA